MSVMGLQLSKIIILAPLVLLSGTSNAAGGPVYLECSLASPSGANAVTLDVTLNENQGTVGFVVRETGHTKQGLGAIFTASSVTWRNTSMSTLEVNRTTLKIVETFTTTSRTGMCRVLDLNNRKF